MKRWIVFATLLLGCHTPLDDLRAEVEARTGQTMTHCGGARLEAPDAEPDPDCAAERRQAEAPYEIWGDAQITMEGDPLYRGLIEFQVDGLSHWYNIDDQRADAVGEGGLFVQRCEAGGTDQEEPSCATECLDACPER